MVYIEYHNCKKKYDEIKKLYEQIVEEKERLFMKTQPKAASIDKVSVDGGVRNNLFDNYLMEKEKKQLDVKLDEVKILIDDRHRILIDKEKELRASKEWIDKIYVYKYLELLPVKKILNYIPYEEAQIYRILGEIKRRIQ